MGDSLRSNKHIGVSENGGIPKSSILIGFSIINHPFWGTTIVGNTHIAMERHQIWPEKIHAIFGLLDERSGYLYLLVFTTFKAHHGQHGGTCSTSSTPTKQHNKIFQQNWNKLPYIYITSNHPKKTTSHNSVTQPLFHSQKRCIHHPSPAGLWVLFSSLLLGPSIPGVALTKGGWMKPASSFCQTGRAGY